MSSNRRQVGQSRLNSGQNPNRSGHMEYLSEDHAKFLLAKEWLVKVDSESSTPYLLKFHSSTDADDLNCCILITDTKSVWGEVLSSKQISRRWRDSNPQNSASFAGEEEEKAWRIKCLEFISTAHSLGGLAESTFEFVKSNYSDLAFTLSGDSFRWRWETFSLGPRMSADILSKHLIFPLISMGHLAFSSADPLCTTSETDLEKSVDKLGRTARRTLDTHVRNALSRPLLATTLRRMTATLNFVPDPPPVVSASKTPDLTPPSPLAPSRAAPASKPLLRLSLPPPNQAGPSSHTKGTRQEAKTAPSQPDEDSVTEEEPEEEDCSAMSEKEKPKAPAGDRPRANTRDSTPARSVPSKRVTPDDQSPPPKSRASARQSPQPQSSSPLPAPKKVKRGKAAEHSSEEEDSEEERKRHLARLKGNGATRGAKQPLKRGGRRF